MGPMCCQVAGKEGSFRKSADVVHSADKCPIGTIDLRGGPVRDGESETSPTVELETGKWPQSLHLWNFPPPLTRMGERRKGEEAVGVWVGKGPGRACVALFRRGDVQGATHP